jgi:hypothetical protein
MKKILLSALLFGGIISQANAQLQDGSIAPNFTVTAYQSWLSTSGFNNNGTYRLYDYLDSGYTVILDVSATWCGPCWNHHLTGALDDLYINHGPAGQPGVSATTTNDVMVIWLDGDAQTADATMLDGLSQSGGASAIGNWINPLNSPSGSAITFGNPAQTTTVGEVPFPMANPIAATANQISNGYDIAYFPTIYKICPNRVITEVGQLTADGFYATVGACPPPASESADVTMMYYYANTYICTGSSHTPEVTIQNNGTTNLTAATVTITQGGNTVSTGTYTGNLATYGVATITCTPITNPSSGAMVATVTTTGDALASNGVINTALTVYTAAAAPLVQDFTSTAFPYAEYRVSSETGKNWTYSSGTMKYDCYSYSNNSKGELFIEPVNLSSLTDPSLSFDVAYRGYTSASPENDKLEVFVSTNCGTTWTSVYNKQGTTLSTGATQQGAFTPATAADWRNEIVSLAAFTGQAEVFVKYVGTSNYGNNMYIDNINISSATSLSENELVSLNVYPNPASTEVNVSFEAKNADYSVRLIDLQGRVIANQNLTNLNGTQVISIPTSTVAKGSYIVSITSNGMTSTKSVVIK